MAARLYYVDRCRALLMLLGVPYHAARLFSPGWGPPQGATSRLTDIVAQTITEFRMPAFFLIAGYFAAMVLSRTDRRDWLRSRLTRLGIPLLTATVMIIPLQLLIFSAAAGGDATEILARWSHRLVQPSASWISHLWFLDDLIIYSIVFAAVWPVVARSSALDLRVGIRAPFVTLLVLVVIVAVPLSMIAPSLGTTFWGSMANRLLYNGVFFLLGAVMFLNPAFFDRWLSWQWWRAALVVAIIGATVPLILEGNHFRPALVAGACAGIGGAWLVLATMKRWGDLPNTHVKLFVDASLTIYLVHHPIILALGLISVDFSLPVELQWLAITCVATLLSLGIFMITRQVPILYFLFNGQRLPIGRVPSTAAA